ncbi:hypothetical protein [Nocardia neocaledoniensis]|uniref:hypothetical protein n=1 Tax=Nocardia neocaledoniensis TaxID=236511 RepID=UPI0024590AB1|nr:hypothetical protein [Nocardia neocaledoniensis]
MDAMDRFNRLNTFRAQAIHAYRMIAKMLMALPIPIELGTAVDRDPGEAMEEIERTRDLLREVPMGPGIRAEADLVLTDWLTAMSLSWAASASDDLDGWMWRSATINIMRADNGADDVIARINAGE